MREVHKLIRGGDIPAALRMLQQLEHESWHDPRRLQAVAESYTHCTKHHDAHRCYSRAHSLAPAQPKFIYNLAAAAVAIGCIEEAERLFGRVIELDPDDLDAWQNRSTLRRQTQHSNHVQDLERMLHKLPPGHPGEIALCYALSKELEDLGDNARSFEYLERGARLRRRQLSYRVEMDLEAIEQIRRAFDRETLSRAPECSNEPGPIFVLGLPRSGTTLVDRILSSHRCVQSVGEINDLPLAVMHAAGPASDKLDLIRRASRADVTALGNDYLRRIAGYGCTRPYIIDKTPLNLLYLGLIRLALPTAKVIHVRRHPLDSGYAMFKTLFRMGYPFSYDLEDLGRYQLAQHALMEHWRRCLPGGFMDVDYETLVHDQRSVTTAMLGWCGLEWDPQCDAFHLNPSPAATASAAQVREPIHTRSVESWRRYEAQLQPLASILRAGGLIA